MPNYEFECDQCSAIYVANYKSSEKPQEIPCPQCGGDQMARFKFSMPNIMRVALPDGTKRAGFAELKAATKMKSEMYKEKPGTDARKEINREIKKITGKAGEE